MSKFNPDFWEVVVERASLETFANEESLWQKYSESSPQHMRHTQEVFRQVLKLIRTELTPRQREVGLAFAGSGDLDALRPPKSAP